MPNFEDNYIYIDCEAKPLHILPAFGFVFNSSGPQQASIYTPVFLPSTNPNPDMAVPIVHNMISVKNGLKIQQTGIYQISYTLTISLSNTLIQSEFARFFLSLNTPLNIIPGSGIAVRSNSVGTGEVYVSSGIILINLNAGNSIQIVPVELSGIVDIRAAALTVIQLVPS